jgi:branched-chain amino acid transport system substrate-binding protein
VKKIRRRDMTLLLGAAALTAALGCEKREPTGEGVAQATAPARETPKSPGVTDTTIKIGSWGPLSGPAAAWGAVLHGMEAYFGYINDQGGIHGRKIEFVYRDDQYNPSKTPGLVRELVEKEGVFAIVSGIGTANGRAVADYLEQQGVPFFSPASGDKFWSDPGKKNVYTAFPRYVTEGEILGKYVATDLGKKKIGVLYQDDDFGKQGLEGVKKAVSDAGGEVVVEVSCQPTDTDLSGQASQIAAKAPEVLVLYAAPKQAVTLAKMLDAQKKKPQLVTSFVLSDPVVLKLAGETWEGTLSAAAGVLPTAESESAQLYREILAKFGKKDGSGNPPPVGNFTLAGFQFATPFVEAMHRAGKDLTREKVYEELNKFKDWKGPGLYFKGDDLGPPITFSETQRLGNDRVYLIRAKGGTWEKATDWLSVGG